jgi:formate hydrogenlyase transcriptional activator
LDSDAKRRMESHTSPGRLQKFGQFLFELSARLISLPPSEIGREIERGLALAGKFWDFDVIILDSLSDDDRNDHPLHTYEAPGIKKISKIGITGERMPWIMAKMNVGETICLECLPDDLPEAAQVDREFCIEQALKSCVSLPFRGTTSVRGVLSVLSYRKYCSWPEELMRMLHHLGDILAGALERKRAAERIDELLQFEHLLSEISATYINLPRDQFEKVIKNDLGRLGRLLGADRCLLYSLDKNGKKFSFTKAFAWWPEEDEKDIERIDQWRDRDPNFFEKFNYFFEKWLKGEIVSFARLDELPNEAAAIKEIYRRFGTKSAISIPFSVAQSPVGALVITTIRKHRSWPEDLVPRLRLFGEVFANTLMRKRNEEEIQQALSEIKKLKEQIEADYIYLREEIKQEHDFGEIVGKSNALKMILLKVKQVAPTDATVLILGETGTGKGLIARAVHNVSKRKDRPLMQVNCAALTASLIESELFGHEKGAFTGAVARRAGRFESAHGTTLFLDEIGDLPLELQPKLLRVLQDGEFERVGGSNTIKTNVRVITATNRDLEKEVEAGRFRRDLWYRLNTFPIVVPPLRDRVEDIPLFVSWFVERYGKWIGKRFDMVPHKTIKALQSYSWPGNIRELENLIERAVITSREGTLFIELPIGHDEVKTKGKSLEEIERNHIARVLEDTGWVIEGPNGAARILDLKPSTLRFRAKKLNIRRPPIK